LSAIEEGILGRVPHGSGGGGRYAHAGGKAEKGSLSPAESAAVSRLLANPGSLTPQTKLTANEIAMLAAAVERGMASHKTDIYLDSKKIAEAMRQNPGASRHLSEAVAHFAQKQAARR
jgi:hypothetical protein